MNVLNDVINANIVKQRRLCMVTGKMRLNDVLPDGEVISTCSKSIAEYIESYGFFLVGNDPENIPINLYTFDGSHLGRVWISKIDVDSIFAKITKVESISLPDLSVELYDKEDWIEECMVQHKLPFYPRDLESGYELIKQMFYREKKNDDIINVF